MNWELLWHKTWYKTVIGQYALLHTVDAPFSWQVQDMSLPKVRLRSGVMVFQQVAKGTAATFEGARAAAVAWVTTQDMPSPVGMLR